MTIPAERSNSLLMTKDFLMNLLDPKKTPRVPKEVRTGAYWCLRHFPSRYDINQIADGETFEVVPYEKENKVPVARRSNRKSRSA